MIRLLNLILNEQMKMYGRVRTWILAILLVLIVVTSAILSHSNHRAADDDWKKRAADTIQHNQTELASSDLPEKFKQQMREESALQQYMLDHNYPPTDNTLWSGTLSAAGLILLVTLFTVIIAGDVVAGEFTWGTIKLLLIRPASRSKILLSKYLSTLIFALTLLVLLFLSALVVNGVLYGFDAISLPHLTVDKQAQVHEKNMLLYVFATYGLKLVELVMIVTLAFMISTVFRSASLAIGLSIFIMFAGQSLTYLFLQYTWGKYFLFANTDLTPYLEGQPLAEGMSLGFSITMLLVYFIVFNALSWEIFRRRDVAA
ncbi:ABC transporter permease [Paenibacillus oryzisoli]|uniref:ABC transporter permease n=1 Tax=Paenibacillus oryzisoli TaxID=1850517 RepID=UPI003D268BD5